MADGADVKTAFFTVYRFERIFGSAEAFYEVTTTRFNLITTQLYRIAIQYASLLLTNALLGPQKPW